MKTAYAFISLFFIFNLHPLFIYSQGEWNNWYFGVYAGLNFNSGQALPLTNSQLWPTGKCPAVISDSTGSLLFYSNGNKLWNKNHNVTPNGSDLFGGLNGSQPVFGIKKIGEDSLYYLFTVGDNGWYMGGLCYSVIDMRLDGGLGDIIVGMKNILVPGASNATNSLTATRHKNNRDVWVITSNWDNGFKYLACLITSAGLNPTPVISSSTINFNQGNLSWGNMSFIKLSPDGTKLICRGDTGVSGGKAELCSFDCGTGVSTPLFKFDVIHKGDTLGILRYEFSPNSKYLYVTAAYEPDSVVLFQYDATQTEYNQFVASKTYIGNVMYPDAYCIMQSGPDGKIYEATFNDTLLNVINYPNLNGISCAFQTKAVSLKNRASNDALPQFLQKYFVYVTFQDICIGDTVKFSSSIWPPADTIQWNFGDPLSGGFNNSTIPNPSHYYSTPGSYSVSLYVRHNDNRTDTVWKTVNVYAYPAPNLGPDRSICIGDSVTFDAGFCNGCTYSWSNLSTNQMNIATSQTFKTGQAGIYKVDILNVKCSGSDTVQLITTPVPQVTNNQLNKSICSGESTNIALTSNVTGTMFHWTASLSSGNISGYSADSGLMINQVLTDNLPIPGVVTYSVTPKVGSCSGSAVDFIVTVNPGDSAKVSITASGNNICSGTPVTFTAVPTNPGTTPVYQWKVNGSNAGGNSPVFTYIPVNSDQVQCILTSSITVCISNNPASSNMILMTVNPQLPVSVSVSSSANNVCAGTAVTFTGVPVNGGLTPVYQWKVNGIPAGTNSPVYTYTPLNNDAITCTLTSSETCILGNPATSSAVIMTVNPLLPMGVSISASSNPFCLGTSVTLTATPVNGSPLVVYQWKVNWINAGTNIPTYTYNPVSGDVVTCILNSSLQCVSGNPATSNAITLTGIPGLPASVSITANPNPFCPGSPVTFTATPGNGGANPSYQWKVNGVNAGSNSPTFTYNPLNNDSVRCVMTSTLGCVSANPATSNKIILSGTLAPVITFTSCFDTLTTVNAKPYKLKGGIPLGGTYSGPGVNSITGTFTPSLAGTGLKSIVYTYTNVALCGASKTKTIIVQSTVPFTCGNSLTDIRDAKTYPTVQIGTQCWMAANLNYGNQISPSQVQFDNCIAEKYCYNDNPLNCTNNGGLYQWDEMMKYDDTPAGQGLCPPGWHIPTETDWTTLFNFYLGNALAGKPLQDTNITGFKALTSGVFYLNTSWSFNGFATLFWSSTPWNSTKGISHGLNVYDYSVSLYPSSRANAFPVRCTGD